MINISERDKDKAMLKETNGIYKIDIDRIFDHYDEDIGFMRK